MAQCTTSTLSAGTIRIRWLSQESAEQISRGKRENKVALLMWRSDSPSIGTTVLGAADTGTRCLQSNRKAKEENRMLPPIAILWAPNVIDS